MHEQADSVWQTDEPETRRTVPTNSFERAAIKQLYEGCTAGTKVVLAGTVQAVKEGPDNSTLVITDHSTITPIRVGLTSSPKISRGATVQISGTWSGRQPDDEATNAIASTSSSGLIESAEVEVIGDVEPTSYPLTRDDVPQDTLRKKPHLRIRMPYFALLARFRSAVVSALTGFFDTHPGGPFCQVHLPVLTWTDCEGGNEVFSVFNQTSKRAGSEANHRFFRDRRYLAVTAALHGEPFAQALGRIWTLAPCFRAESVDDERHLAEFWMLEVALNHISSLETLLELLESMIAHLITQMRQSAAGQEILSSQPNLHERWSLLSSSLPYPRITVSAAVQLLQAAQSNGHVHFSTPPQPGADINNEHELYLVQHFRSPVFLTHFPTNTRLFTALQSTPPDPAVSSASTTTESFDLLLPDIGEICSGGLREHRLDVLLQVMRKKGLLEGRGEGDGRGGGNGDGSESTYPGLRPGESLGSLEWFADLRRWGSTPHGGFGIGFERLLMFLCGAGSVKDVVSFPRYLGVCES